MCRLSKEYQMADALLPVPIFDQQYSSLIEILPSAKHIQSFNESQMGTVNIQLDQSLEWGFLLQVAYSSYYQAYPAFFIYPNMSALLPMIHGANGLYSSTNSIIVSSSSIIITIGSGVILTGLIVFM